MSTQQTISTRIEIIEFCTKNNEVGVAQYSPSTCWYKQVEILHNCTAVQSDVYVLKNGRTSRQNWKRQIIDAS